MFCKRPAPIGLLGEQGVVWGGIGVGTALLLHHCHQCFKIHNPQRRALTELKPTKVSFLVCLPCKEKCELSELAFFALADLIVG